MSLYIHILMFLHFGQDATLAFSEMVRRNIGEGKQDFNKLFAGNSQPLSLITGDLREYGNTSSAPKNVRDGTSIRYVLFLFFW